MTFTRTSRAHAMLGAMTLLAAGCAPEGDRSFDGFESWTTYDRGVDAVPPNHPDGTSTVYVDALPPPVATEFPVGTHIVRVTAAGDDPTTWEAHAMVKVGGDFNPLGAVGWEFYGLALDRDEAGALVPRVQWRGEGPTMNDGYAATDGSVIFGCNTCHATATYNDFVLGDELFLDSL